MRSIKNIEKLTKEKLITTFLKSESNTAELNFKKLFNNNNTVNNDTYDDKIRGQICNIRMILSRLGNINDQKKIKKELYEIEKGRIFQTIKKKRFMVILLK